MSKKPLTLEFLFKQYCNYDVFGQVVLPQKRKKKKKNVREEEPAAAPQENPPKTTILLSQIGFWLNKANLLGIEVTMRELRAVYLSYKAWNMDFETFQNLLHDLCKQGGLQWDKLKTSLIAAGPPVPITEEHESEEDTAAQLEKLLE